MENCHSEGEAVRLNSQAEARRIPCVQKPALQSALLQGVVRLAGDSSLRCASFRMTVVLLCIGVMFLIPLLGGGSPEAYPPHAENSDIIIICPKY